MKKRISVILGVLLIASCARNSNNSATTTQDSIRLQAIADSISAKRSADSIAQVKLRNADKLQPIGTLPDTVTQGCYGIFSESRDKFSEKAYIIATNRLDVAVVYVNDSLIYLSLKEKVRSNERSYKATYSNGSGSLRITAQYVKRLNDEAWIYKGKAVFTYNGKKTTYVLYGQIGC